MEKFIKIFKRIILNFDCIIRNMIYIILFKIYLKIANNQIKNPYNIPVYIISYNRLEYLKQTLKWLESYGHKNIKIIDNNSTYPPLIQYYNTIPYKVYRLKRNYGHMVFFKCIRFVLDRNFKLFCITDPDITPISDCPDNYMNVFIQILSKKEQITKVGFSLKIDDLPDDYNLKNRVIEWESHFYEKESKFNNTSIYLSEIDTTFALYRPMIFCPIKNFLRAYRVGYPYQARHLPWYVVKNNTEEDNYNNTRRRDITTWNGNLTSAELDERLRIINKR